MVGDLCGMWAGGASEGGSGIRRLGCASEGKREGRKWRIDWRQRRRETKKQKRVLYGRERRECKHVQILLRFLLAPPPLLHFFSLLLRGLFLLVLGPQ